MENEKNTEDLSLDDSKEESTKILEEQSIEESKDNNEEQVNKEEKPPKQRSLVKNGLFNTFYQILAILTPLITTPYVSRILGSTGIGVYSFTHSLVTYFMLIAGLGTLSYGTREIARRRQNKKDYSKAFFEIELLTVITSIISLGIWLIVAFVYQQYSIYLLICSFYILSTLFDISWLYIGLERINPMVIMNSICKILGVVFIFVFVKTADDVFTYIMINALVIAVSNLSMWLFLPRYITKAKIDFSSLKGHLKETLIYFIPSIATSIYTVLDKTLLGFICQDDSLNGYYEQGTKIINLAKAVSFIGILGVVSPRMSFLYKVKEEERIKKTAKSTLNIVLFLSIAVSVGIAAIADVFVPMFFGEGYDLVVTILYMMLPLCVIISVSSFLGDLYYTPVGKRKESALYLIIGSCTNLVLNLCLIPFFNVYGAIIATLVAEIVITVLYFIKSNGFISVKDLLGAMWKKLIAAAVMFVVIYFMKKINYNFFEKEIINQILENVILIASGAIVYCITCFLLRDKLYDIVMAKLHR